MDVELRQYRDGSEGFTGLHFSKHENTWLSADGLGQVYKFPAGSKDGKYEPLQATLSVSPVTALAISADGKECIYGSDNSVSINDVDNIESEKLGSIVRRTLPITDIQVDSDGNHIFVSSMEPDVFVYSRLNQSVEYKVRSYDVGVKSFALSPRSQYIAMVDQTSTVTVSSLHCDNGPLGRRFTGQDQVSRIGHAVNRDACRDLSVGVKLSWHPFFPILAIPSNNGSIILLCAENNNNNNNTTNNNYNGVINNWDEQLLVTDSNSNDVTVVSFSPNGRYLISGDLTANIILWNCNYNNNNNNTNNNNNNNVRYSDLTTPLRRLSCDPSQSPSQSPPICDIAWGSQKGDNYVIVVTANKFAHISNIVHSELGFVLPTDVTDGGVVGNPNLASNNNINNNNKNNNSSHQFKRLKKAGITTASILNSNNQNMNEVNENSTSRGHTNNNNNTNNDDDDDDDKIFAEPDFSMDSKYNDINALKNEVLKTRNFHSKVIDDNDENDANNDDDVDENSLDDRNNANIEDIMKLLTNSENLLTSLEKVKLHPTFMSNTTTRDEKGRRYLAWNSVGNITSRSDNSNIGNNRIEFRFTDINSGNKPESFADGYDMVMAAMGSEGAIFANEAETPETPLPDEEMSDVLKRTKGSIIYYHSFNNNTLKYGNANHPVNESFHITLNDGESATTVAVGSGWSAVTTSKQLLRIFSNTGIQLMTIALKGSAVSMVGFKSRLAVFYNSGLPVQGSYNVSLDMFEIDWKMNHFRCLLSDRKVPLSPKSELIWVSFDTESGRVVTLDSRGMVHMLFHTMGFQFIPILDINAIKKSPDHIYWPVMSKGTKLAYVLLNGENKPAIYPQPVLAVRSFLTPIVEIREGKDRENHNERNRNLMWESLLMSDLLDVKGDIERSGIPPYPDWDLDDFNESLLRQEKECDKSLLKAIQESCRVQKHGMAIDLTYRLRSDTGLASAITIANHFGATKVAKIAENIVEMRNKLLEEQLNNEIEQSNNNNYNNNVNSEFAANDDDDDFQLHNRNTNDALQSENNRKISDRRITNNNNYNNNNNNIINKNGKLDFDSSNNESFTSQSSPPPAVAANPFAMSANDSPINKNSFSNNNSNNNNNKRKSVLESLQEMKGSPSPKKPTLSRTSSFSQAARTKLHDNKRVL